MAYLGIGYSGPKTTFYLRAFVEQHGLWLKGDRLPHFFGDDFVVLYDSNTAREFVRKCKSAAPRHSITVYSMSKPLQD